MTMDDYTGPDASTQTVVDTGSYGLAQFSQLEAQAQQQTQEAQVQAVQVEQQQPLQVQAFSGGSEASTTDVWNQMVTAFSGPSWLASLSNSD